MIAELKKIKKLLKTRTQIYGKLFDRNSPEGCRCFEGVLLEAWGYVPVLENKLPLARAGEMLNPETDESVDNVICEHSLKRRGIPFYISRAFVLEHAKPTKAQKLALASDDRWSWHRLNDEVKLNFKQFSMLLAALDKESKGDK